MTTEHALILAGTSESGKSSAGLFFERHGVLRLKVRSIINTLTTGHPAEHLGYPTREMFSHEEFMTAVLRYWVAAKHPVIVLESLIDPEQAEFWRKCFIGTTCILFIDAPEDMRVRRSMKDNHLDWSAAREIVQKKDFIKGFPARADKWSQIADYRIWNDGALTDFEHQLNVILVRVTNS